MDEVDLKQKSLRFLMFFLELLTFLHLEELWIFTLQTLQHQKALTMSFLLMFVYDVHCHTVCLTYIVVLEILF